MRKLLIFPFTLSIFGFSLFTQNADASDTLNETAKKPGAILLDTPDPKTAAEHNNRGNELGQKKIWPDAIREHELALQMDPKSAVFRDNLSEAHHEYGKWLVSQGSGEEALAQFRLSIVINPANASADADLDAALRTQKHDPSNYDFRHSLAVDADASHHYETSIVEWRKCIALKDSPQAHSKLGSALIKAGKTVEGFKELRTSVSTSWPEGEEKELSETHRQLGDILMEFALKANEQSKSMQRLQNAATEYNRAVTIDPGNRIALNGLLKCKKLGAEPIPEN